MELQLFKLPLQEIMESCVLAAWAQSKQIINTELTIWEVHAHTEVMQKHVH